MTTFFRALVDVKNAQVESTNRASGHDYRPDLPGFVSEVCDIPTSPEQFERVAAACREGEMLRWQVFHED